MNQLVRAKLGRNADYHSAMAEHYTGLQKKATNGGGLTRPVAEGEAPPANGRRSRSAPAPAPSATSPSSDDLAKLVAMHSGAAEQLRAVLASEQPQAIIKARAKPPVTRATGPVNPGKFKIH